MQAKPATLAIPLPVKRHLTKLRGNNKQEFYAEKGLSRETISHIESKNYTEPIQVDLIKKYAQKFNKTLDDIFLNSIGMSLNEYLEHGQQLDPIQEFKVIFGKMLSNKLNDVEREAYIKYLEKKSEDSFNSGDIEEAKRSSIGAILLENEKRYEKDFRLLFNPSGCLLNCSYALLSLRHMAVPDSISIAQSIMSHHILPLISDMALKNQISYLSYSSIGTEIGTYYSTYGMPEKALKWFVVSDSFLYQYMKEARLDIPLEELAFNNDRIPRRIANAIVTLEYKGLEGHDIVVDMINKINENLEKYQIGCAGSRVELIEIISNIAKKKNDKSANINKAEDKLREMASELVADDIKNKKLGTKFRSSNWQSNIEVIALFADMLKMLKSDEFLDYANLAEELYGKVKCCTTLGIPHEIFEHRNVDVWKAPYKNTVALEKSGFNNTAQEIYKHFMEIYKSSSLKLSPTGKRLEQIVNKFDK